MTDDGWSGVADFPERVAAEAVLGILARDGLPCYIASDAHVPGLGSVFSIRVPQACVARARALIGEGLVSDEELTALALGVPRAEPDD